MEGERIVLIALPVQGLDRPSEANRSLALDLGFSTAGQPVIGLGWSSADPPARDVPIPRDEESAEGERNRRMAATSYPPGATQDEGNTSSFDPSYVHLRLATVVCSTVDEVSCCPSACLLVRQNELSDF